MRHEIEIQVKVQQRADVEPMWYPVDAGSGNTLTLDYVSNLLSDVSKITSSHSFTAKLPRTRRNDAAFDLAVIPQHDTQRQYRYLPCRVFADGIDVSGTAYMYLVSSEASTYNVVIVFGLMQEYKSWIDSGKSIKELEDGGKKIEWNWRAAYIFTPEPGSTHETYDYPPIWYGSDANINTYSPQNGIGRLMYYGIYDPGFVRNDVNIEYANIHPFVTMREIYERIVAENSLSFRVPEEVLYDMEDLAIVLTKVGGNSAQGTATGNPNYASTNTHPMTTRLRDLSSLVFGWNIMMDTIGDCWGNGSAVSKGKIKYKGDGQSVDISVNMLLADNSSFSYNGSNRTTSYILDDVGHLEYLALCINILSTNQTVKIIPTYTPLGLSYQGQVRIPCVGASEGDEIAEVYIDNDTGICSYCQGAFEEYWVFGRNNWDALFSWTVCTIIVRSYTGSQIYPHPSFRCFPNLPDISQLDFVKMICHLYGLFPCQKGNSIDFVPIERIEDNKDNAYDWSRYLLEEDPDVPHHTDWHMSDVARHNRVSYKEDPEDLVIDEAFVNVDDDTLEREKELFTIPLAASDGDLIDQYDLTPVYDNPATPTTPTDYDVESRDCEHRLMRVVEWYDAVRKKVTRLSFQNLSSEYIVSQRYAAYQSYVMHPHIITERLRVPLSDLRTLDYSRPVYLSKYGRHFAIIDIKWTVTQDVCEAKFLML